MKDSINIRKVEAGDENILALIQTESWKSAFNKILTKDDLEKYTNLNKAREMYKTILSKNIGNGFIMTVNEKPHCIAYWDNSRDENMEGYAELICIHSLNDNWGKGYGTVMMDYILRDIKNAGFKKIMLWVFEENNRARKFYEKHGFYLTEKYKKFSNAIEFMYSKEL